MDASPRCEEFIADEEGTVLTAYKCPAGVWTIGNGLTAASGVVKPYKGMTISAAEARRLLRLAIARNYAPRVRNRLGAVPQHVFDGAVSFDFNTGRIHNAGWVTKMLAGNLAGGERQLRTTFVTGGGRVLKGLVNRRGKEADIIFHNKWPRVMLPGASISSSNEEIASAQQALKALGYYTGNIDGVAGPLTRGATENFQRANGLKVDGIIGPATRATLTRELERKKANGQAAAGGAAGSVGYGGADAVREAGTTADPIALASDINLWAVIAIGLAAAAAVWVGWWLWRNRGIFTGRRVPT